ncbi:MAG: hypothetical protein K0R76_1158, partial [Alphaproteobacteria bacterium]|nr:hypothetical protein [Alphaproteobacteria bacterium]MDF3034204.1 hypothetical protein [Alphaproteobacteria bacterium]
MKKILKSCMPAFYRFVFVFMLALS